MHFQNILYEISRRFLYTINYTNDAGERVYALVTTSPEIVPEGMLSEVLIDPELEDGTGIEEFVFWDLFTETVLRIPVRGRDISFKFDRLDLFSIEDPEDLLYITDQSAIDNHNTEIINIHNNRREVIIDIQTELSTDYDMVFSEQEIIYYISLINTHYFAEYKMSQISQISYLIKLCMLLKSTPYKLLRGEAVEQDFNTAKGQWRLVIKHYVKKAKEQLDLEVALLDKEADTYEYDLEEIEIIKSLLDEIPDDFMGELDECDTYHDLLEAWPPLLLPAPNFIIEQQSGMNAFEQLKRLVEWKFYD